MNVPTNVRSNSFKVEIIYALASLLFLSKIIAIFFFLLCLLMTREKKTATSPPGFLHAPGFGASATNRHFFALNTHAGTYSVSVYLPTELVDAPSCDCPPKLHWVQSMPGVA